MGRYFELKVLRKKINRNLDFQIPNSKQQRCPITELRQSINTNININIDTTTSATIATITTSVRYTTKRYSKTKILQPAQIFNNTRYFVSILLDYPKRFNSSPIYPPSAYFVGAVYRKNAHTQWSPPSVVVFPRSQTIQTIFYQQPIFFGQPCLTSYRVLHTRNA